MLAQMPARWLQELGDFNLDGQTRAAVITGSTTTPEFEQAVQAALTAAGITPEMLSVDLPTSDFSPVIARIVARDALPDAIFIYIKGSDALSLQAQLLAAGIGPHNSTVIVQQYAGLDSGAFWAQVPDGVGTVVARIGPWQPTVTAKGQEFTLAYAHYAGQWPSAYDFAAYDAIHLLADAVQRAGSLQGAALVVALEEAQIELASGTYSFPYGSLNPPGAENVPGYLWHQWPDVQTLYLQYTAPQQPAGEMLVIWPARYRQGDLPYIR
jgi:ABC-type branched-subunit amino acid transport system substrate-binding protein